MNIAPVKSKGHRWASLSMNQQAENVPRAVFLRRSLDMQQLSCPSNRIIPADQAWHFLCSGRDGMLCNCAERYVSCLVSARYV